MKKIAFALALLFGAAAFTSCDRDRCPQHGQIKMENKAEKRA